MKKFGLEQTLRRVGRPKNSGWPQLSFASANLDMGLSESGLLRLIKRIKTITGIKYSCHTLRHTFATLMLEGGTDIYSLSRMLGHTNIKTTTIYLYASVEHLRSQMSKHPLNDM